MRPQPQTLLSGVLERARASQLEFSHLRRYTQNAIAILTSDVFHRATTFLIYALVSRHLGAYEFGQLSLALTLFYTAQMVAGAGLRTVITREVAKAQDEAGRYLIQGSIVVLLFSTLSWLILWAFCALSGYQADTQAIILVLAIGLLPAALSTVCEGIFRAREQMGWIAVANTPVNLLKLGLAFLLLQRGEGVYALVLLLVASHSMVLLIEWGLILRAGTRLGLPIESAACWLLLRTSLTFLGVDVVIAVWSSTQTLLLSVLRGEVDVGLYSAGSQLLVPVLLIFQSIASSVFPVLCRRFEERVESLGAIAVRLLELLLAIAIPATVGLYLLADRVLLLLYGNPEMVMAAAALRIQSWVIILNAGTTALGQILWASKREQRSLQIVTINLLLNVSLSFVLVYLYGLNGAALAALITMIVNFAQHLQAVSNLVDALQVPKLLWKPMVAAAVMAGYLMLTPTQSLFVTIPLAALVYATVLVGLFLWQDGALVRKEAV
jgi:O-antigen/teichoic acid export membrane protein